MLLVGAALLMQSFLRVLDVNLGFQPEHAAALRIDPGFRISNLAQQNSFIDDVLHRARSIPGVTAAGISDVLPLDGDRGWQVSAKGQVYDKDHHPEAFIRVVSDGYFEALGIALKSGRAFTESDRASSEPVVMVNETMARTLWPGQDAVGQMVTQDGGRRVVGVVADVHHGGPESVGGSEMYLPMRQTGDYAAMKLVVRTALPPDSLAAGIRTALRPTRSKSPGHRVSNASGVGRQSSVATAFSGHTAVRICGVRVVACIARDLRADFLFGESAHQRNWYTYGVGSERLACAARGSHQDAATRSRRGGTGDARLFRVQ